MFRRTLIAAVLSLSAGLGVTAVPTAFADGPLGGLGSLLGETVSGVNDTLGGVNLPPAAEPIAAPGADGNNGSLGQALSPLTTPLGTVAGGSNSANSASQDDASSPGGRASGSRANSAERRQAADEASLLDAAGSLAASLSGAAGEGFTVPAAPAAELIQALTGVAVAPLGDPPAGSAGSAAIGAPASQTGSALPDAASLTSPIKEDLVAPIAEKLVAPLSGTLFGVASGSAAETGSRASHSETLAPVVEMAQSASGDALAPFTDGVLASVDEALASSGVEGSLSPLLQELAQPLDALLTPVSEGALPAVLGPLQQALSPLLEATWPALLGQLPPADALLPDLEAVLEQILRPVLEPLDEILLPGDGSSLLPGLELPPALASFIQQLTGLLLPGAELPPVIPDLPGALPDIGLSPVPAAAELPRAVVGLPDSAALLDAMPEARGVGVNLQAFDIEFETIEPPAGVALGLLLPGEVRDARGVTLELSAFSPGAAGFGPLPATGWPAAAQAPAASELQIGLPAPGAAPMDNAGSAVGFSPAGQMRASSGGLERIPLPAADQPELLLMLFVCAWLFLLAVTEAKPRSWRYAFLVPPR